MHEGGRACAVRRTMASGPPWCWAARDTRKPTQRPGALMLMPHLLPPFAVATRCTLVGCLLICSGHQRLTCGCVREADTYGVSSHT